MKRTGLAVIALAAALSFACDRGVRDETTTNPNPDNDRSVGTTGEDRTPGIGTRNFIKGVAEANMAEIELGRLASERAQSAEVKQFGQMMVTDHTKAGDEFKSVVSGYNVELPTALDDKHKDLMTDLQGKRGAEFDRAYIDAMVDGHKDVKGKLEDRAHDVKDPPKNTGTDADARLDAAINQWSAKTLPAVEKHLLKAEEIQGKLANRNTTAKK